MRKSHCTSKSFSCCKAREKQLINESSHISLDTIRIENNYNRCGANERDLSLHSISHIFPMAVRDELQKFFFKKQITIDDETRQTHSARLDECQKSNQHREMR